MFVEDVAHALWDCVAARDEWSISSRNVQKMSDWDLDFFSLMEHLANKVDKQELVEIVVTMRQLRLRRNAFIIEDVFLHHFVLVE